MYCNGDRIIDWDIIKTYLYILGLSLVLEKRYMSNMICDETIKENSEQVKQYNVMWFSLTTTM